MCERGTEQREVVLGDTSEVEDADKLGIDRKKGSGRILILSKL